MGSSRSSKILLFTKSKSVKSCQITEIICLLKNKAVNAVTVRLHLHDFKSNLWIRGGGKQQPCSRKIHRIWQPKKNGSFFLILIDWTTCWLPTVFFIYNAGHYFRCSLTLLVNTCLLFIGKIKKVAKVILQLGNQGSLCLHEVKLIWFSPSHRKCFLWMHFIWQTLTTKIVFGKNTYFPL